MSRLRPGAQQTFDHLDGDRFTVMLTDQGDDDIAVLDQRSPRARPRGAAHPRRQRHRPGQPALGQLLRQRALGATVLAAQDLLAFFAVLACDGDLATAEPETIRYRLLHVADNITPSARRPTLHLHRAWPWLANDFPMLTF